jgi:hypothetical protein
MHGFEQACDGGAGPRDGLDGCRIRRECGCKAAETINQAFCQRFRVAPGYGVKQQQFQQLIVGHRCAVIRRKPFAQTISVSLAVVGLGHGGVTCSG